MSNQDNEGLSIFDDDEPGKGTASKVAAGAAGPADAQRRKVNLARPDTSVPCHGHTNDALRGVVRARTRT